METVEEYLNPSPLQLVNRVNHASIISAALKISPESEIQKCKVLHPLLFKYHWNLKFKNFKSKEIKEKSGLLELEVWLSRVPLKLTVFDQSSY